MTTRAKRLTENKIPLALHGIEQAERTELMKLWQDLTGGEAPRNLSLPFLRRAIAFEMQCRQLGGPKAAVIAAMRRIAEGQRARTSLVGRMQTGTRLIREWRGKTWSVEVTEAGFLMGGDVFDSLSAIAKKITGAHWSGPRFFGLKAVKSVGTKAVLQKIVVSDLAPDSGKAA